MSEPGIFITLEGIEGSGKTTQAPHLLAFMEQKGFDCVQTREPGGTGIGKKIRAILLNSENLTLAPMAELLLYEADRAQHIARIIRPNLMAGKCVVCDRFCDATIAYQGYARGLSVDFIDHIHTQILKGLKPNLTLIFDLPAQKGLARARARLSSQNQTMEEGRFEAEALLFHEKVRKGYLTLAHNNPKRFKIIDAAQPVETVMGQMLGILENFLKKTDS